MDKFNVSYHSTTYPFLLKFYDTLIVLRGLSFLIAVNLIGVFAFFIASQGTDVLLSIVEDSHNHFHLAPMLWLLTALFFWGVASEFCSRFLLYLSDNSGRSLAPNRVIFRKSIQKKVAKVFLFLPIALTTGGVIKAWIINGMDIHVPSYHFVFSLFTVLLLSIGIFLYFLYLKNGVVNLSKMNPNFAWLSISPRENQWVQKLYGILNDVRVDIPSAMTEYYGPDLPRNKLLPNGIILPREFVAFQSNPIQESQTVRVWMFKIPLRFYRCLKWQFLVLFCLSVLIILLFSFLPVNAYSWFGAASLICFALGCWQVMYTMLHFADKAQNIFPVRLFFVLLFLLTTIINRDHPVRVLKQQTLLPISLKDHFNRWFTALKNDPLYATRSVTAHSDSIPIVFVATEGGALRTGAFTALVLSKLADRFPNFSKHIYCHSGVSGGALGSNYFNSLYIEHQLHGSKLSYADATKKFFKRDFLSAVTGKLVFAEILGYFIPFYISRFDRAVALEQAWEQGWESSSNYRNWFSTSFDSVRKPNLPAIFIILRRRKAAYNVSGAMSCLTLLH